MTIALRQRPLARVVQGIVQAAAGCWLDPSDMATMFQDAAGTIPVTAVEQPVGKMLDKSGRGNHATQSVTASRPTLSARKNLLLATETLATQSVASIAASYVLSFYGTGSVTLSGTSTRVLTGTGVNNRVSVAFTPTAGTLTLTVSGSVTKAQLELGSVAGPYQRVNTATNYDTNPRYFPKYLRFDGIDDYLNLPYMGLYAGGSASVVIGMSQFGPDGVFERIFGETSSLSSSQKYIMLRGALNGADVDASIVSNSSTAVLDGNDLSLTLASPVVVSAIDTGSLYNIYKNSIAGVSNSYSRIGQTITLTNTTLGAQIIAGGTYNAFSKMNLYGLLITKSALSDAQRIQCERLLARKSGVIL